MLKESERCAWYEFGHTCGFTAACIGGKVDLPVFLPSERRKTGTCRYTAGSNGGKASFAGFPPVRGEENLQLQYLANLYLCPSIYICVGSRVRDLVRTVMDGHV